MFEYVKLKNFKSFDDIEFNLLDRKGNPKKIILLYGKNGVGKSNLASAFFLLNETLRTMDVRDFMQKFLSKNDDLKSNELANMLRARYFREIDSLIKEYKTVGSDDDMVLEFGFVIDGKKGKYTLSTNNSQITSEKLEFTLSKNKGIYYDLSDEKLNISTKIFKDKKAYNEILTACEKFWGKHTLLSILLHETDDKSTKFMQDQISDNFKKVIDLFASTSSKVKIGSKYEHGNLRRTPEIMLDFEEGKMHKSNADRLDKTERMLNKFFKSTYTDINRLYYKKDLKDDVLNYELMVVKNIGLKEREISFSFESTGTQSVLEMLPFMLMAAKGSVTVIDEFDLGLHDLAVSNLISSLYNCIDGQLILTTHNTILMKSDIPKECIYTIDEYEEGKKEIHCITHFDTKIHTNTNIRDQYYNGKYHGIPTPEHINFKELLDIIL